MREVIFFPALYWDERVVESDVAGSASCLLFGVLNMSGEQRSHFEFSAF